MKYPYPTNIITNYRKDFNKQNGNDGLTNTKNPKDAFNLEKEHKIINPHPVDNKTTARVDFQPFSVVPHTTQKKRVEKSNAPF